MLKLATRNSSPSRSGQTSPESNRSSATSPTSLTLFSDTPPIRPATWGSSPDDVLGSSHSLQNRHTFSSAPSILLRDWGLKHLNKATSLSAMYDSDTRIKCHPGTRAAIINSLLHWITSSQVDSPIWWLHAPFGHGKSAILQTLIQQLLSNDSRSLFGGAFFFRRDDRIASQAGYLFPTIASQLAFNMPGMAELINQAMVQNPNLPNAPLFIQLLSLIIDPIREFSKGHQLPPKATIMIDGLDECESNFDQTYILYILSRAIEFNLLSFRILIASRPETHIIEAFSQEPLSRVSKITELDKDWQNATEAGEEMQKFFEDGFQEIYNFNPILSHRSQQWPLPGDILTLVRRSCGQYLYATTILSFVGRPFNNPITQLKTIIQGNQDAIAFSNMDKLYRHILSSCPIVDDLLPKVLACLLFRQKSIPSLDAIANIWDVDRDDVNRVVEALRSVLSIRTYSFPERFSIIFRQTYEAPIPRVHHISFKEFLEDRKRSRKYCCDTGSLYSQWVFRCRHLFEEALAGRASKPIHQTTWTVLQAFHYSHTFWDDSFHLPNLLPYDFTKDDLNQIMATSLLSRYARHRQRVTGDPDTMDSLYARCRFLKTQAINSTLAEMDPHFREFLRFHELKTIAFDGNQSDMLEKARLSEVVFSDVVAKYPFLFSVDWDQYYGGSDGNLYIKVLKLGSITT
ncbi:hypothetical protein CPB83DRAFT_625652 [Crepidotus variabilis]|uniref:Nephrocystin 3-like N-terminal domain-containing protein n=1 Tax=Crepidotus variabilis TaxID=179855 RepID=A0A9P6JU61_9AGAR|nr:hypothetical protein CPB83DRAFT_625652 [Crepidotus variabilis]